MNEIMETVKAAFSSTVAVPFGVYLLCLLILVLFFAGSRLAGRCRKSDVEVQKASLELMENQIKLLQQQSDEIEWQHEKLTLSNELLKQSQLSLKVVIPLLEEYRARLRQAVITAQSFGISTEGQQRLKSELAAVETEMGKLVKIHTSIFELLEKLLKSHEKRKEANNESDLR